MLCDRRGIGRARGCDGPTVPRHQQTSMNQLSRACVYAAMWVVSVSTVAFGQAAAAARVIVADDIRHARWIRGLVSIEISALKP